MWDEERKKEKITRKSRSESVVVVVVKGRKRLEEWNVK